MQNDEITVSDVLRDRSKNLCNILKENDVDDSFGITFFLVYDVNHNCSRLLNIRLSLNLFV